MFNGSYLRVCMKLRIVQKIRFSLLESGRTKAWCPALVSRMSAKAQEPVARSRGLVIQPQKLSVGAYFELLLVHILSFHSQSVVSLFIFPTGPTALDSEPRGRRYAKNTGHDRNRLYSRAIHCPTSMEKHYVQWFILKSVQDITVCEKIDFAHLSLGGPNYGARVWCLGRVPKHRNHWQELEGLLFSPKNSQLVHILSFLSQGVVSLLIFPTGPTALDSEPRGRRYVKNMGHDWNRLYSRVIHSPTSMEMYYVQWFLLKSVYEITDYAKNQIFPS